MYQYVSTTIAGIVSLAAWQEYDETEFLLQHTDRELIDNRPALSRQHQSLMVSNLAGSMKEPFT